MSGELSRVSGVADASPADAGDISYDLPEEPDWIGKLVAPFVYFTPRDTIDHGIGRFLRRSKSVKIFDLFNHISALSCLLVPFTKEAFG